MNANLRAWLGRRYSAISRVILSCGGPGAARNAGIAATGGRCSKTCKRCTQATVLDRASCDASPSCLSKREALGREVAGKQARVAPIPIGGGGSGIPVQRPRTQILSSHDTVPRNSLPPRRSRDDVSTHEAARLPVRGVQGLPSLTL